ncbi:MAG: hydrogenase expression/formation protein HypE [Candidatus Cloacimonetes bacterium]|nr:hydrogenase expression/formation protein HypE [Candidatus Cloacimonadota bacterium]
MKDEIITLGHGSGAGLTKKLINEIFDKNFKLPTLDDAVEIENRTVVTTDAHVIKPIFFPGGDIGKLSVTGTVNDVSMKGAIPKYLLITYIIEEGFPIKDLKKITESVQEAAEEANVKIIAGDTKVVERGKADGIYITTTGIGFLSKNINLTSKNIQNGDKIIVNGTIGDHTVAIINARENLNLTPAPQSDCASLNNLVQLMLKSGNIKFIRDATRGGVATILNEVFEDTGLGIIINEEDIPIKENVEAVCGLLGLDALYMANEGKLVSFVSGNSSILLEEMKNHKQGKNSTIIGEVTNEVKGVYLRTSIGGLRPLMMLDSDPLPRIC